LVRVSVRIITLGRQPANRHGFFTGLLKGFFSPRRVAGAIGAGGSRQLKINSFHFECEILQFPVAFDLQDNWITRSQVVDHLLEL